MKGKILITDTLFIFPEHEQQMRDAGYEIERLETPTASEEIIIEHLSDKVGYILGGLEKISEKVIEASPKLKAIVFTGAGWKGFIPGYEKATKQGILIANTPGANASAVAEYTLTLILSMTRNLFDLGRTGDKKFQTTHSLNDQTIGIIGMGNIGTKVANILQAFGANEILYHSNTQKPEVEKQTGAKFVSLNELLTNSDIITLHTSQEAGGKFIGEEQLSLMKDGSLIVNCGFTGGIDRDALYNELQTGRLRAAQDDPMDDRFSSLPLSVWFNSNSHTAYNTFEANKTASDMATKSLLNLLENGEDQYKVN